jgi:hypothetical protein
MASGIKRTELQVMAQAMLDDAMILFKEGRVSNAYYLSGYAVELGLKACIAVQISAETIPDKGFIKNILNHQFNTLVGLAGLQAALKEAQDKDAAFAANWAIVSEWSPDSRYETKDKISTELMLGAVGDAKAGVLQWIKAHW